MCGILGMYNPKLGIENHKKKIINTLHISNHRGPDENGTFFDSKNNFSLGMNRLSIVDIKNGHQPLFSNDGRYCIIFNGEIVNSEEIKDFPYRRGSYLVCANGKAIPTSFWRNFLFYYPFDPLNPTFTGSWDSNTLNDLNTLEKYHFRITAEVIVGKEPKRYSKDEQEAIMKRFMEGVRKPNSYKSTSVVYGESGRNWLYKFKNSENKKLSIRKNYGFHLLSMTDNNGNTFKGDVDDRYLVMFYCTNDYIVLRAVEKINYRGQVTNEFNENIELPTIFWIREVGVKAEPPNMKKNYEF